MIKVTIKTKEVQKLFEKLSFNAQNMRPALRKIGGMLERTTENAFNRQGPGWKPLKAATKTQKQKAGFSGGILTRRGDLAGSVTSQIEGNTVFIGSNLEYAGVHQFGFPAKKIPKRPFLIVSEAELRKSNFIISKHLLRVT